MVFAEKCFFFFPLYLPCINTFRVQVCFNRYGADKNQDRFREETLNKENINLDEER